MSAPEEGWTFFRRSSTPEVDLRRSPDDILPDFEHRLDKLRPEGFGATTPRNEPMSIRPVNEGPTNDETFPDVLESLRDDVLTAHQLTAMKELDVENNPLSRKRVRRTDTIESLQKKITAVEGLIKLLTEEKLQRTREVDRAIQTYYKSERSLSDLKTYKDALKTYNKNNPLEEKRIFDLKKQLKALQDGKVAMEKDKQLMESGDNGFGGIKG